MLLSLRTIFLETVQYVLKMWSVINWLLKDMLFLQYTQKLFIRFFPLGNYFRSFIGVCIDWADLSCAVEIPVVATTFFERILSSNGNSLSRFYIYSFWGWIRIIFTCFVGWWWLFQKSKYFHKSYFSNFRLVLLILLNRFVVSGKAPEICNHILYNLLQEGFLKPTQTPLHQWNHKENEC